MRRSISVVALVSLGGCGLFGPVEYPAAPVEPEVVPEHLAPEPTDASFGERGSPQGSAEARPDWAASERGYVPVLSAGAAASLFEDGTTSPAMRTRLEGELLACRLDVAFEEIKSWSFRPKRWANADLLLFIGFGRDGAKEPGALAMFGANQSNTTHFVLPAARLAGGDGIDILVNDRDRLLARDFIDRVWLPFDGGAPLRAEASSTKVECRVVEGEPLTKMVRERLWAVDDALVSWRQAEPDIRSGTLACSAPESLSTSLTELAAVLGWDDSRMTARLGRAALVETEVKRACADRFVEFVASLDPVGVPATLPDDDATRDLGVRVLDATCDPATTAKLEATVGTVRAGRCTFGLEVTQRGSSPAPIDTRIHPDWTVEVFDAAGRPMPSSIVGAPREIPPRQAGRVDFAVGDASTRAWFSADKPPQLPPIMIELRERGGESRTVRLRLPAV